MRTLFAWALTYCMLAMLVLCVLADRLERWEFVALASDRYWRFARLRVKLAEFLRFFGMLVGSAVGVMPLIPLVWRMGEALLSWQFCLACYLAAFPGIPYLLLLMYIGGRAIERCMPTLTPNTEKMFF